MFNPDLNSTLNRTIFVVLGVMLIGLGLASLRNVGLGYHNWWGGLVFGPFAIVFGALFIVAMLRLGSLQSKTRKPPRKSQSRPFFLMI
jgi:hypothetical protein